MRRFLSIWLLLLVSVVAAAQGTTRVRGLVKDAETGEPLPFVGVYFDGTTIGISTDMNGHYSLETRSPEAKVLTAQLIGYESLSIPIQPGSFSEINFTLRPDPKQLAAAYVKPDNRYIRSILRKISQNLEVHDPDNAPDWSSRLYSKIEIDVTNMEPIMKIGFVDRHMGFMNEYADTSAITGQAFIPALISENVSDLYHSQDPQFQREVMRYSHMSGFDTDNVLREYTGAHLLRANFYKRSLTVLNLEIPNPVAASSQVFYNYYLVDSLQVQGRKTYVLRFHPKKLVTSPTLDGEMQIDAEDFGIRSVHAALSQGSNVNWIRHINVDIENRRTPEGRWFFDDERLFIDFSIASSDSSRILSFLGRRQLSFQEPVYAPIEDQDALNSPNQVVERNVQKGTEQEWTQLRPYPLASREQGIFDMVEAFQQTRFYRNSYGLLHGLITGYFQIPAIRFEAGPWAQFVSYNETEGVKLKFGGRTYKTFSEVVRLGGYFAYGLRDKKPKWQASAEFMLSRKEHTRKLSLTARHDYSQFGSAEGLFSNQTVVTSLVARSHSNLQSMVRAFDVLYEHEFNPSVNASLEWTSARVWGSDQVPFIRPDGSVQESFSAHTLHAKVRFSKDERVSRNTFKKTYLFTKYPIFTIDVMGGIKGITKDDISYIRATANLNWKIPSHAIGFGLFNLEGGAIWGSIPYPLLKIHEGNRSYFMDRSAFSLMEYYEFVSDRWLSGFYEHNFNGFFLGKIPLVKELDLREVVTARFAWGTLSKANRENAPFLLPPGAGTLETPYVELGVGIANILRVLRVDFFWRVTHRLPEAKRNFTVNIGFDVDF